MRFVASIIIGTGVVEGMNPEAFPGVMTGLHFVFGKTRWSPFGMYHVPGLIDMSIPTGGRYPNQEKSEASKTLCQAIAKEGHRGVCQNVGLSLRCVSKENTIISRFTSPVEETDVCCSNGSLTRLKDFFDRHKKILAETMQVGAEGPCVAIASRITGAVTFADYIHAPQIEAQGGVCTASGLQKMFKSGSEMRGLHAFGVLMAYMPTKYRPLVVVDDEAFDKARYAATSFPYHRVAGSALTDCNKLKEPYSPRDLGTADFDFLHNRMAHMLDCVESMGSNADANYRLIRAMWHGPEADTPIARLNQPNPKEVWENEHLLNWKTYVAALASSKPIRSTSTCSGDFGLI